MLLYLLVQVACVPAVTTGSAITEELMFGGWQNCTGQSIACGWNHHSDQNSVEIGVPGRHGLSHLQFVPSSPHGHCSHHPSHAEKLYRKGESAGRKLFWAGAQRHLGGWAQSLAYTLRIDLNCFLLRVNIWIIHTQQNESSILDLKGLC